MFHRYAAYPGPNQKLICGPIVGVWQNRHIVRVVSEDKIGEEYIEGTLSPAQLDDLLRSLAGKQRLLLLKEGYTIRDTASEQLGIRLKRQHVNIAETIGDWEQFEHNADMAALRKYLMSLEIAEPHPAAAPWKTPPEDWYE